MAEKLEPNVARRRTEIVLPSESPMSTESPVARLVARCLCSTIDSEPVTRVMPRKESADPSAAMLSTETGLLTVEQERMDKLDPSLSESSKDKDEPARAWLRRLIAEPSCAFPMTDSCEQLPSHFNTPATESVEPSRI